MSRQEAERLEEALGQAARGEYLEGPMVPLVQTARRLHVLSSPSPPPPRGLVPGRERFLAEAARLRARKTALPAGYRRMPRTMRFGVALAALLIVFGVLFGAGQAVASSLPGSPLYELKLTAERARLTLTADPQARADLLRSHAEERLDEIIALLNKARIVDGTVVGRTEEQWTLALTAASRLDESEATLALQKVATSIQQRQPVLQALVGTAPEPPLRELLRELERVRQEAHLGQGEPEGQQERHRSGEPADPTDLPIPSRTPLSSRTPQPTTRPSVTPYASQTPHRTAKPSETPAPSRTPQRTARPSETPQPSRTPAHTAMPSVTPHRTAQPSASPPGPQTPASIAAPSSTPQGEGGMGSGNPLAEQDAVGPAARRPGTTP